ncbi:hypothetical protein EDC04DRAFT_2604570 [Pisolithus marmoratus]|nr:hypothetical protein EDC04DRAFT_2604570 [Pisolithus marmoratus]
MLEQADPDNLRDKGKSKAQEPEVPSGDGNIDEGSDLIQVSVSMDKALITPPSTLQFSREREYDVTIGDCVQVVHGPAVDIKGLICSVDFISGCLTVLSDDGPLHDVLIGFCIKLENHSLCDVECQVGCEVWIISSPRKGYRGMLQSVSRTYCNVMIKSGIMQLKNTTVVTDQLWILQPNQVQAPWPVTPGSPTLTILPLSPSMSWHKQTLTMIQINFAVQVIHGHGLAPPGHVSVTVTSSTVSTNIKHHFIPACDLTPANLRSAGQIHQVKKCQVKKDPKGVELEDSTKLLLGDVCQVISAN